MTVSVLGDCTLTLAANGQNNFVQGLWSAATTYNQVEACPTGASLDFADDATATATTALGSLLATSIYAEGMTASVAVESGVVTITSDYLGNAATLTFRSSGKSGSSVSPVPLVSFHTFLPDIITIILLIIYTIYKY